MLAEDLHVAGPEFAGITCFGPGEIRDPNRPAALDEAIRQGLAAFMAGMDRRTRADLLADDRTDGA